MHLAITDKIPNRNKLVPEFVLSLLLVNRLREEYMYIWTMRRACEIEAVSSCVDDANFVSHNDYCSNICVIMRLGLVLTKYIVCALVYLELFKMTRCHKNVLSTRIFL